MFSKIKDRYLIEQQIGKGGFAEVFLAWDELLERQVVLKIAELKPEFSYNARREVRMVSRLNHPNIIRYFDLLDHEENGIRYEALVMEHANFGTLADFIYDSGKRRATDLGQLFLQMLEGIHYYHQAGIVHKDLKPQNILLHRDAVTQAIVPKIADFFISKYHLENFRLPTGSNEGNTILIQAPTPANHPTILAPTIGTPEYMAPERILEGERGSIVEPRTDLWSFGIIVYETFRKERPFGSRQPDDGATVISANVVASGEVNTEGIPPPYDEVVRLCLEKDLGKRVGDARILMEVIRQKKEAPPPAAPATERRDDLLLKQIEEIKAYTVVMREDFKAEILRLKEEIKAVPTGSILPAGKKELLDLIRNNEIERCFERLNQLEDRLSEKDLRILINLQGQWTDNKTMTALGMVDAKEEAQTKNRIRSALIEFISGISL